MAFHIKAVIVFNAIFKTAYIFAVKDNRKLMFMYLANDVIQNSKKKGPEFGKEFETVLPKAFEHMKGFDEKTRERLNRLLQIWEERGVYDKTQIAEFKTAFTDSVKDSGTPPPKKKAKVEIEKVKVRKVNYLEKISASTYVIEPLGLKTMCV